MMRQVTKRGLLAWKFVLCLLLAINVATGIIIIVLVVRRDNTGNPTRLTSQTLKARLDKIYEEVNGGSIVKEKTIDNTSSSSLEFLSLMKPVVHLPGIDGDDHKKTRNSSVIRNWVEMKGSSRCLIYNGPKYDRGTITIPVKGMYVVYSHVKFYVESFNEENGLKEFKHEIIKSDVNSFNEETLAANELTECREGVDKNRHLDFPSDVRGVFELNAGDEVMVRLSHPHLLTDSTDWNYFGLYMI